MSTELADPFAEMQQAAKRQQAEENAAKAMSGARSNLVLSRTSTSAFFATLAMGLKMRPDWNIDTAQTDGKLLKYNPDFALTLKDEVLVGLLAHEVLHLANKHHARMQDRDHKTWNIACDLAINQLLVDAGYDLPSDLCLPGNKDFKSMPRGLSAEDYYSRLQQPKGNGDQGDNGQDGDEPGNDPGGCGGVEPPGDGSRAANQESEAEWDVKVIQAGEAAKRRGELPCGIQKLIGEIKSPKVDWRSVLREFVTVHARNDYSWSPPNRRYIHMGLYLPGMRSEELGEVMVAVDTSGSIGPEVLHLFGSELQGILDAYSCKLKILYHDSKIAGEQTWESADGPLVLDPKGGGGTDHRPVFEHIEAMAEQPTCLVCLTDMESCFPAKAPGYPVLWASTAEGAKAPFGQIIHVE